MTEQNKHHYPNKDKDYIDIREVFHISFKKRIGIKRNLLTGK